MNDIFTSNSNHPKVLILLATFNGERWLSAQIQSIFSQNGVNVKIVARDDASTDSTLLILNKYLSDGFPIQVIESDVRSGSAGNNFKRLIAEANISGFDYVALCDQDDIWFPDKILRAINLLKSSFSNGYSSSVQIMGNSGEDKILSQSNKIKKLDFIFEGAGQGCTFLFSSADFSIIASFFNKYTVEIKEFYYHDWLIYLLSRAWGWRWCFDETPSLFYRQHGGNETGARYGIIAYINRMKMIKNGWYRNQINEALNILKFVDNADQEQSIIISNFERIFFQSDSMFRRVQMIFIIMRAGRRRIIDRCALSISALCGWI